MPLDRFDVANCEQTMWAVVTTGNGGYERLEYRQVPVPRPGPDEVLLRVLAAGINNTEINTRIGWYSSNVTTGTEADVAAQQSQSRDTPDGGWNEATPFPFIQGTDCCGRIVEIGAGGDAASLGKRVLVRACMRLNGFESFDNVWMASDFDGAFAQFVKVPADEVFPIDSDWSDVELATLPCAYGTAENMVHRAGIQAGDRVLVTGASGGVGSAVLQLCKRRGAHITAVTASAKLSQVYELGAGRVVGRHESVAKKLGDNSIDVVFDNVAGDSFGELLDVLTRGGRYVSSGAIGGPLVTLDMRKFYLKDLSLIGCTAWDKPVFPNLIAYVERNEVRPLVAKTFPLEDISIAQREFLEKKHVGNFVLIPPEVLPT